MPDDPKPEPEHTMDHTINLWSAMTRLESEGERDSCTYPRVTKDDLAALGWQARFYMQELSIRAIEGGWEIRIFSYDTDCIGDEVIIFTPKDGMKPCEIRKDRYGRIKWHHS